MADTPTVPAITQQKEPDVTITISTIVPLPSESFEELTGMKLSDIGRLSLQEIQHLFKKYPEIMSLVIRDLYLAAFVQEKK